MRKRQHIGNERHKGWRRRCGAAAYLRRGAEKRGMRCIGAAVNVENLRRSFRRRQQPALAGGKRIAAEENRTAVYTKISVKK